MRCLAVVGVAFALCALAEPAVAARIDGTDSRDTLRGTKQADVLLAGAGGDVLSGGRGDDRLHAGPGADILSGGRDQDTLFGGPGRDRLSGDAGHDVLRAGGGDDVVGGGVAADTLEGGSGDDSLAGGPGPDTLDGGAGDDELTGGAGEDGIVCGDGDDVANADDGDDVAEDCETVERESGDEDERSWGDTAATALFVAVVVASLLLAAWLSRRVLRRQRRMGAPPSAGGAVRPSEWLPYMLPFPAFGIAGIVTYSLYIGDASALAVSVLVAAGVFLVGSLFGFLFGIPKSLAAEGSTARARPFKTNTNLEEISDWLTKIIVGLTLIQLGTFIDRISEFADFLVPSLGGEESAQGYAIAILALFGINGFLIAYVATRLYAELGFARGRAPEEKAADNLAASLVTGALTDKKHEFARETREQSPSAP